MSAFYKNYVELCAKKKKSLSAVAEEIGLSRTSPNGWKKGKQPSDVNIQKLAEYFGVSVEYLRGEEEQKENPTAQMSSEVDEVTMELMDIIQNGSDEDRQDLLEMYKMLKRRTTKKG